MKREAQKNPLLNAKMHIRPIEHTLYDSDYFFTGIKPQIVRARQTYDMNSEIKKSLKKSFQAKTPKHACKNEEERRLHDELVDLVDAMIDLRKRWNQIDVEFEHYMTELVMAFSLRLLHKSDFGRHACSDKCRLKYYRKHRAREMRFMELSEDLKCPKPCPTQDKLSYELKRL